MKYILVYNVDDYLENNGGLHAEEFESENDLHDGVNKLAVEYKDRFSIKYAGYLQIEYKYNPVTYVTKYEPTRI